MLLESQESSAAYPIINSVISSGVTVQREACYLLFLKNDDVRSESAQLPSHLRLPEDSKEIMSHSSRRTCVRSQSVCEGALKSGRKWRSGFLNADKAPLVRQCGRLMGNFGATLKKCPCSSPKCGVSCSRSPARWLRAQLYLPGTKGPLEITVNNGIRSDVITSRNFNVSLS